MSSQKSLEDSSELLEKIDEIKERNAKLEGAREQIISDLRDLGYKTSKDAEKWLEESGEKLEQLRDKIKKEKKKVQDQLDEYDQE